MTLIDVVESVELSIVHELCLCPERKNVSCAARASAIGHKRSCLSRSSTSGPFPTLSCHTVYAGGHSLARHANRDVPDAAPGVQPGAGAIVLGQGSPANRSAARNALTGSYPSTTSAGRIRWALRSPEPHRSPKSVKEGPGR